MKERGTCDNRVSVRQAALEEAVLATLQTRLFTKELAETFVTEFRRQADRLRQNADTDLESTGHRLREVNAKIDTLGRNMLVSEASPTLHRLLAELEQEKAALEAKPTAVSVSADIVPHPELLRLY